MRWEDERESTNVDDLRGDSGGGGFGGFGGFGGGGFGGPVMIGGGGLGAVVLLVLYLLFGSGGGGDGGAGGQPQLLPGQQAMQGVVPGAGEDTDMRFVKKVAAFTEDTWTQVLGERGITYTPPRIEVYSQGHETGCGYGQAAMGPFYCPNDRMVWLDLSFFNELSNRFGAPGRFAEAYVVAHEVGHHVQTLLGTTAKVDAQRNYAGKVANNRLSVRLELQADCYAGVWANRTNQQRHFLDPGDMEQGLAAASAVGDDTLQKETQGRVVPDAFTHGTSEQRTRWFKNGFDNGSLGACDTFAPPYNEL